MNTHDVSEKLKDLVHKIEIEVKSTDSRTLLLIGNLLSELQMLATDRDPKRVMTILSLIVQLQKKKDDKTPEEQKKS